MFVSKLRRLSCVLWLFPFLAGCGPSMYTFVVTAPARYSGDMVLKSMEIMPFEARRERYAEMLENLIRTGVAQEGYIDVVYGDADCSVAGSLHIDGIHEAMRTESYDCSYTEGKGKNKREVHKTCEKYVFTKTASIRVNYELYSNMHNRVLAGDSLGENFDQTWTSLSSPSDAESQAPSDDYIINHALTHIAQRIVATISPHKERVSRELQAGSDPNIKLAISYLENGRTDQAFAMLDQVVKSTSKAEDRCAAYYNMGVIKESLGHFGDALQLYRQANALKPSETLYIKALTRVEKARQDAEKAMRQTGEGGHSPANSNRPGLGGRSGF